MEKQRDPGPSRRVSRNCLLQLQMQPQSELDPTPQPATGRTLEVRLSARGVREAFKQWSEMCFICNVQGRMEPLEKMRKNEVQDNGLCEERT